MILNRVNNKQIEKERPCGHPSVSDPNAARTLGEDAALSASPSQQLVDRSSTRHVYTAPRYMALAPYLYLSSNLTTS
jgi:hypothetical protein